MNLSSVCPLEACKKRGECIRHIWFLKAKAEQDEYETINPDSIHPDDNGCEHRLMERKVRIAYGFKKLYDTMPVNKAKLFWTISGFGSESTFCRYKRGDKGLSLNEQRRLIALFSSHGADVSVGFDRYQDETVFVKPGS